MTEYRCENCKELSKLAPNARFCPYCGSTSLILVIKELTEPAQKETVGVYTPPAVPDVEQESELALDIREEEDQPRPRSKQ